MAKDSKNINIEVPKDIWKKLTIMSVHKDISFKDLVIEVLDNFCKRKGKELEEPLT